MRIINWSYDLSMLSRGYTVLVMVGATPWLRTPRTGLNARTVPNMSDPSVRARLSLFEFVSRYRFPNRFPEDDYSVFISRYRPEIVNTDDCNVKIRDTTVLVGVGMDDVFEVRYVDKFSEQLLTFYQSASSAGTLFNVNQSNAGLLGNYS